MRRCIHCGNPATAWVYHEYYCEFHADLETGNIPRCFHCEAMGVTDSRNPYISCGYCQLFKEQFQEKAGD